MTPLVCKWIFFMKKVLKQKEKPPIFVCFGGLLNNWNIYFFSIACLYKNYQSSNLNTWTILIVCNFYLFSFAYFHIWVICSNEPKGIFNIFFLVSIAFSYTSLLQFFVFASQKIGEAAYNLANKGVNVTRILYSLGA